MRKQEGRREAGIQRLTRAFLNVIKADEKESKRALYQRRSCEIAAEGDAVCWETRQFERS